jgi:hypothetical protein
LKEYLGDRPNYTPGSGMVDHVAFYGTGFDQIRGKLVEAGLDFTERKVPSVDLQQLFVADPSGIVVELNFPL